MNSAKCQFLRFYKRKMRIYAKKVDRSSCLQYSLIESRFLIHPIGYQNKKSLRNHPQGSMDFIIFSLSDMPRE